MADSDNSAVTVTPVDPNSSPYGTISPVDRDLLIRTVIGEAGNDPASAPAVAGVVLNRLRSGDYGSSVPQVLFAPNQFESWDTKGTDLLAISPNSPQYQKAAATVDGLLSGKISDPSNGATKFYSPAAQADLGRQAPAWDDGSGVMIGQQKFFGGGAPDTSFLKDFDVAPETSKTPAGGGSVSGNGMTLQSLPVGSMPPATASASPPASGPDFMRDFPIAPPSSAKAGADGLVWDAQGGRDPNTGELIIAGKPFSENPPSQPLAGLSSFLAGVPIVGPYLERGAVNAAGLARNALYGDPQDQTVNALNSEIANSQAAYPKTTMAGNVGGAVLGTAPAMAYAPAAFGISDAGIIPNALLGGVTGGVVGGADTAARSGLNLNALEWGAGTGAALGAAGPIAGKFVGSAVNALSGFLSRSSPAARNIGNVLAQIGMTPLEAQQALARMGPEATLADISPAMTTEAGGLAALGGAPTDILKGAMAARASNADDRVLNAVDQTLGPKPDLTASEEAIYNHASQAASPFYNAARASGKSMNIAPVISNIDSELPNAVGGEANVLKTARSYLTQEARTLSGDVISIPKSDPQALLKARQALDDYLQKLPIAETTAGRNAMRALAKVRSDLDGVLKTDPNIAAGDAAFSSGMKVRDALEKGTELFTRGVRLEDFKRTLAGMSPVEVNAMRQGARVAIGDALDQARRGALSGAQSMFAKASVNRAKLDALFPNAGKVFDMINTESAMRSTEQRVAQNSATAERAAVAKKYSAPSESGGGSTTAAILGEAVGGGPGAAASALAQKAFHGARNALSEASRQRLIEGTARGLIATGPEQSALLDQIGRATRVRGSTNALASGSSALTNLMMRTGGNALAQHYLPAFQYNR